MGFANNCCGTATPSTVLKQVEESLPRALHWQGGREGEAANNFEWNNQTRWTTTMTFCAAIIKPVCLSDETDHRRCLFLRLAQLSCNLCGRHIRHARDTEEFDRIGWNVMTWWSTRKDCCGSFCLACRNCVKKSTCKASKVINFVRLFMPQFQSSPRIMISCAVFLQLLSCLQLHAYPRAWLPNSSKGSRQWILAAYVR